MSSLDEFYPLLPPRPCRQQRKNARPNFNKVHALPLPLTTFPLPPLIPHNPLSLLQIAYTYLSHFLFPPSTHNDPRIRGYYSSVTKSVHITDPTSIRLLWERGFFGKGSLSRSEPTWLNRELKRQGLLAADTSEEITAARREERKRFKNERARKEREAIEEMLMEELLVEKIANAHPSGKGGKPTIRSKYEGLAEAALLSPMKGIGMFCGQSTSEFQWPSPPATPTPTPETNVESETVNEEVVSGEEKVASVDEEALKQEDGLVINGMVKERIQQRLEEDIQPQSQRLEDPEHEEPPWQPQGIENQEHLQLTPEEAFFLAYALGALDIYQEPSLLDFTNNPTAAIEPKTATPLTTPHLLTLFSRSSPSLSPAHTLQPNSTFFLLYTAYHHFRSLGWVVRPGLKFGVDYLLYLRGPVFSHAEFAVTVLPAYTHHFWRETEQGMELLRTSGGDRDRSWHWLHCVQRVQSQVRKTLVVAWVDVPPSLPLEGENGDVASLLKQYNVREMVVKRWIPNRSRD